MAEFKATYQKAIDWLWLILVALLPLTSVPIIAKLSHSTDVAPASGIVMLILVAVWLIPHLVMNGKFPKLTIPVVVFFLSALFSTAAAFFLNTPAYKSISILSTSFNGLLTLFIGVCFYLVASTVLRSKELIQKTLRMFNWTGLVFIVWSALQLIMIAIFKDRESILRSIQSVFSIGRLYNYRATGFALEPSWLAHTLNIVYLPYWLAATVEKTSAHKFRFKGISLENILLVGGTATLIFTFSRVGWIAFFLMILYVFIRLDLKFAHWILKKTRKGKAAGKGKQILFTSLISIGLIVVLLGIVAAGALFASKIDMRMASLFTFKTQVQNPLLYYANTLKFGERLIYWISGWQIFNDYPLLGVGVGNAGFYMPARIVPYGWSLLEVQGLVYHSSGLLNIKSLWFRLPAETGIIGVVIFLTWLYMILRSSRMLQKQTDAGNRTIGLMGVFMLLGLILEGVSVDSFALPYIWITAGIISATGFLAMNRSETSESNLIESK